jgi:threonine synthase
VGKGIYSLELFHGPMMAFKDVGARFMSRCLAYFNKDKKDSKHTVLVATPDTGARQRFSGRRSRSNHSSIHQESERYSRKTPIDL